MDRAWIVLMKLKIPLNWLFYNMVFRIYNISPPSIHIIYPAKLYILLFNSAINSNRFTSIYLWAYVTRKPCTLHRKFKDLVMLTENISVLGGIVNQSEGWFTYIQNRYCITNLHTDYKIILGRQHRNYYIVLFKNELYSTYINFRNQTQHPCTYWGYWK